MRPSNPCIPLLLAGLWPLSFAQGAPATAAPATRPTTQPTFRDRYAVIAEKNIFLKDRAPRSSSRSSTYSSSRPSYTPPPPEASYVLTGIVLEEGQYRAYVEDTRAAKIIRLSVGDAIARGTVSEIQIDAIAYESSGQTAWVDLGRTLAGLPFVPPMQTVYVPASTGSAGATTGPTMATTNPSDSAAPPGTVALDPNDPNLTFEQRLKLRRQMELNKIGGNK